VCTEKSAKEIVKKEGGVVKETMAPAGGEAGGAFSRSKFERGLEKGKYFLVSG